MIENELITRFKRWWNREFGNFTTKFFREILLVGSYLLVMLLEYLRVMRFQPVSTFVMMFIGFLYFISEVEEDNWGVVKFITVPGLIMLACISFGLYEHYETDYKKALQETVVKQYTIENIEREQEVDNWEGNGKVLKVSYTKNSLTNTVTVTDKESIKLALHSKDKSKLKLAKVKYSFSNWFRKKYPTEPVPDGEYKIVVEGED